MSEAGQRIQVLTGSLRCFVLGGLSLVPLLWLPLGAWALVVYWKTSGRALDYRNPAQAYLEVGLVLALFGLLLSGVTVLVAGLAVYRALSEAF